MSGNEGVLLNESKQRPHHFPYCRLFVPCIIKGRLGIIASRTVDKHKSEILSYPAPAVYFRHLPLSCLMSGCNASAAWTLTGNSVSFKHPRSLLYRIAKF
jgi:hypothetical protein